MCSTERTRLIETKWSTCDAIGFDPRQTRFYRRSMFKDMTVTRCHSPETKGIKVSSSSLIFTFSFFFLSLSFFLSFFLSYLLSSFLPFFLTPLQPSRTILTTNKSRPTKMTDKISSQQGSCPLLHDASNVATDQRICLRMTTMRGTIGSSSERCKTTFFFIFLIALLLPSPHKPLFHIPLLHALM